MPLLQAYGRPSTIQSAAAPDFMVAIAGEAPASRCHSGGFATTRKAWGILAAPFVEDPCNGLGPASCSQAMALRAFKEVYSRSLLPRASEFSLLTDNTDLAGLLIGWQNGDETLPAWYAPGQRGSRSTLGRVQRAVARIGSQMAVRCIPAINMPPVGDAARTLATIGQRYLNGTMPVTDMHSEGARVLREARL